MSFLEHSRLLSRSNAKQTGMESNNIESKSWKDLQQQLLENHKTTSSNTFQETTLEQHQRKRRSVIMLKPTNSRKAQLLSCKLLNYNLAIMDDGKVLGVKNQSSPNGIQLYLLQFICFVIISLFSLRCTYAHCTDMFMPANGCTSWLVYKTVSIMMYGNTE